MLWADAMLKADVGVLQPHTECRCVAPNALLQFLRVDIFQVGHIHVSMYPMITMATVQVIRGPNAI